VSEAAGMLNGMMYYLALRERCDSGDASAVASHSVLFHGMSSLSPIVSTLPVM
jgi:hypothetical protein